MKNGELPELHQNLYTASKVTTYARERAEGAPASWVKTEWHGLEVCGGTTGRWWRGRPKRHRKPIPWMPTALRELVVLSGWGHPEVPMVDQPDLSTAFAALANDELPALMSDHFDREDRAVRRMLLEHLTARATRTDGEACVLRDYRGALQRPDSVIGVVP